MQELKALLKRYRGARVEMMRLIVDGRLAGSMNMALDQALLQSAAESEIGTLRIYGWQPATVSLGYFQNYDTRESHAASIASPVVRRASGGGAIVHDLEMTYSLALPASDPWASRNRDLFDTIHRTLIEFLEQLGVEGCRVFAESKPESKSAPFLCFQRRANGDVVIGDDKVIGSAQRRLHNALLQHGSVLVQRSEKAPELPGIVDLCPDSQCTLERVIAGWPQYLAEQMAWELVAGDLTSEEVSAAKSIESEQFSSDSWTRKR